MRRLSLSILYIILVTIVFVSICNYLNYMYLGYTLAPIHMANDGIYRRQNHNDTFLLHKMQKQCNLEIHLKRNLTTDPHAVPAGQGFIIYTCRHLCGGFADRKQGVASAYIIAKHTGRLFRVEETSKCGMTTFLRPSFWYNWTLDQNNLRGLSTCFQNTSHQRGGRQNDFVQYINDSVIYLQTNQRTFRLRQNFREIFYTLFTFHTSIVNEIETFKTTFVKNNKTVCAHLRVGKSANFIDTLYNNLGNLSAVWQFLSLFDREGYVIYIASDSMEVLDSARERFNKRFVEMGGPIIHIDLMDDDMRCSGFRKLVLDFAFLSQCDILLLTASNLGKHVSLLRNKREDQYCFQYGKVYPCPIYNMKCLRSFENNDPLIHL